MERSEKSLFGNKNAKLRLDGSEFLIIAAFPNKKLPITMTHLFSVGNKQIALMFIKLFFFNDTKAHFEHNKGNYKNLNGSRSKVLNKQFHSTVSLFIHNCISIFTIAHFVENFQYQIFCFIFRDFKNSTGQNRNYLLNCFVRIVLLKMTYVVER